MGQIETEAIDGLLLACEILARFHVWRSRGQNLEKRAWAYIHWWTDTQHVLDPLVDLVIVAPSEQGQAALLDYLAIAEALRKDLKVPRNGIRDPIPQRTRREVMKDCGYICQYCGGKGSKTKGPDAKPWHIDHVTPVFWGGDNSRENLTLACATCNISKWAWLAWKTQRG